MQDRQRAPPKLPCPSTVCVAMLSEKQIGLSWTQGSTPGLPQVALWTNTCQAVVSWAACCPPRVSVS